MKKFVISLVGLVVLVVLFFSMVHNQYTDYLNPLVQNTVSYAKVSGKKSAGNYKNVVAYRNNGATHITLAAVGSYDSGKYIKIYHKGQFVKTITYISRQAYLRHTTKA